MTPEEAGLLEFAQRFPGRFFDVSVAQQHAVTFAAGLASEGLRPVVAIPSTYLQRTYDQLIHDVALQKLPVMFAVDSAGLVGGDGATHHGSYDLSYLRCIPNLIVMAPADENECRQMLYTASTLPGPAVVRYPRAHGPGASVTDTMSALPVGRAQVRREGRSGNALLVFGAPLAAACAVAERLDATLVNMRFVKPLDVDLLTALSAPSPCAGHDRGERGRGRGRLGGRRGPGLPWNSDPAAAAWDPGSLHRAWLARDLSRRRAPGCGGRQRQYRALVRAPRPRAACAPRPVASSGACSNQSARVRSASAEGPNGCSAARACACRLPDPLL